MKRGRELLFQLRYCAVVLLMLPSAALRGQTAATIPASSTIYERLESVSAYFPARGVFLGERSLSRREVGRVVARLLAKVDSADGRDSVRARWARAELQSVARALGDSTLQLRIGSLTTGLKLHGELFGSDAEPVRIEPNGLGEIDAVYHPFAANRYGMPTPSFGFVTLAPTGLVAFKDVAVVAQPFIAVPLSSGQHLEGQPIVHRAYGRGVFHNAAIQVGTDELHWGQSPIGALFLSGNARPFPAISVSTDTAVTLPWLFRLAGPVRMTGLLSDLGPTQRPSHTKLAGWLASIQPWTRFELGVSVTVQTGGEGAPPATFLERVVDLFPIIDALAPQHADLQISNKLAGGNLRMRFPELSGMDVYYELQIDDFDGRRLRSSFVDDAGHLLGVRLPLLVGNDQLEWRAEWHRTSLRLYEHAQFVSGSTYHQQLIGDPIGPHATAGYLSARWRTSGGNSLGLLLADEIRDPNQYHVEVSGPRDTGFTFHRDTDDPRYHNRRVVLTIDRMANQAQGRFSLGYNRAWRAGEAARHEWMGVFSIANGLAAF